MSDNAEIVFAGNAKGLLDEYKKLEKANEQLSQKLAASMKVSKQAANEEKKLRQEVTQAIEKSKTPAEAYIATINRYKQALQAGMITAEQFNRIRDVELAKINAGKVALQQQAAAEQDATAKKAAAHQQALRAAAESKAIQKTQQEQNALLQSTTSALLKIQTPAQAYNATLTKYKQALQSGMITQEQFNKLRDKELVTLNASKVALDRLTDSKKKEFAASQVSHLTSKMSEKSTISLGGAFTGVAATLAVATMGIKAYNAEQRKLQEESSNTTIAVDKMAREYAIQAGIPEDQVNPQRDKIIEIARKNSIPIDKAFAAAQQLSSVGFDDPVSSGALDSFMKIQATSNLRQGDPKQLASSMAQFLNAYELPVNEETMTGLGVRMRGLMAKMVEVSELENFAKAAPVLATAKIPIDEGLAYMAQLRDKFQAPEAATGIKNVVSILRGASADKSNTDALAQIGLTPEDVDMVGETMTVALQRLDTALQKAPEEKRAGIRTKLFGRENEAASSAILSGLPKVQEYIDAQSDTKGFLQGVERANKGEYARDIRQQIELQQAQLKTGDVDTMRTQIANQEQVNYLTMKARIDASDRPWYQKVALKGAMLIGKTVKANVTDRFKQPESYYDQESLERIRNSGAPAAFTEKDLRARMGNAVADPQAPAMAEQTKVLKEISNKLTPPAKPTENPNLQGRPK